VTGRGCWPPPGSCPAQGLTVEAEPGYVGEDGVRREERRVDVDCRRRDPEIVGVDRFMQRVSVPSAPVAELRNRDGGEEHLVAGHETDMGLETERGGVG